MPLIKMVEGELLRIPAAQLPESVGLKIHQQLGRQIHIEFPTSINRNHYTLHSNGYIGKLSLDKNIQLQIEPKITLGKLFAIIEYAYKLNFIQFLEGATTCQSLDQWFDFLAVVLAKKVRTRVRRGLLRDYEKREGQLTHLRGRLMPDYYGKNKSILSVPCRFFQQTTDLLDNRILAWTLYCLDRFKWQDQEVKQIVHHAFGLVAETVDANFVSAEQCRNRVYHRFNQDYRSMHAICRFFLENCGPNMGEGKREFTSLLVYMPSLFESFVAEWLKVELGGSYQLQSQFRVGLEGSHKLAFKIDLVLREVSQGSVLAVLDTKYKVGKSPQERDIQQVVAYAVRMKTNRAFLVYPSVETESLAIRVGDVLVKTMAFDLAGDLQESGAKFRGDLLASL